MTYILMFVFVLSILVVMACVVFLVRNEAVFRFRQSLLQEMMDRVTGGEDVVLVDEQLEAYHQVPYKTMVFKFWKPLNNHEWFEGTALDTKETV